MLDPHGDPIPDRDLAVGTDDSVPLTELDPGERGIFARVSDRDASMLRFLADRSIARAAAGEPLGPESSIVKIAWSNAGQLLAEVAFDVLGMGALSGPWVDRLASARSMSIAGGTTEVNRTIVAERVLGLPRE